MIDLHTHSTVSDGTDSPRDLVRLAAEQGISTLALTDHDTTVGWAEARIAAEEHGIQLIEGAEFSTTDPSTRSTIHMLAYLFDPASPDLVAEIGRAQTARRERGRRIVDLISADYPLTWEDVSALVPEGTTLGRPHIAEGLIAKGIVQSRDEAFDTILYDNGPYDIALERMSPLKLVKIIAASGGVSVAAHPRAATRNAGLSAQSLTELADAGLFGLEVRHPEHDEAARIELTGIAQRLGLAITGSSDYHGHGKSVRLAAETTTPDVLEALTTRAAKNISTR